MAYFSFQFFRIFVLSRTSLVKIHCCNMCLFSDLQDKNRVGNIKQGIFFSGDIKIINFFNNSGEVKFTQRAHYIVHLTLRSLNLAHSTYTCDPSTPWFLRVGDGYMRNIHQISSFASLLVAFSALYSQFNYFIRVEQSAWTIKRICEG